MSHPTNTEATELKDFELDTEIEELEPKIAPDDGGELVLPSLPRHPR